MAKKISEQLVETLAHAGVERIYAVTGDSLNEVNDAVRKQNKVKWVHVRHEETGAFAASAEAQLNGIACCAGSSGPGHVHLINGVYDAHQSNAPVFVIASTCPSSEFGTSYFQETDPIKLFEDCSGYAQMATTPVQFSRMLQGALQHTIHRKEVSVLGLPGDLAADKAEDGLTTQFALPSQGVYRPRMREIEALARLINGSEKITLFCGVGARNAHSEILKLASLIHSPIGYSFKSKMDIQYDNPYEVGMTGLLGLPSAYASMHDSDLLILLGTDFPYENFMPQHVKIVQVDIRPERIGRRAKVDFGFGGDVKDTLEALLPFIHRKENDSFLKDQLKLYESVKKSYLKLGSLPGKKGEISPEYVASLLNKTAAEDAIFCVDTGMCCVWGARFLEATGKRVMLGSFRHGSMANAMPMAIGAALARPEQPVIALCGDGGLSMLLGDLATIVQYRLPIKLVVFNNRALGMVKLEMEVAGLPDWQTDLYNPDFAKVAEAMGMPAFSVDDPQDVEHTLKTALSMPGPVLVSVQTDPDALAMPPKIEFEQMKGFALSMAKLIIAGKGKEVWDTASSNMKHLREIFRL